MPDETATTTTATTEETTQTTETTTPAKKPDLKFSQEDMNAQIGNTRKEATATANRKMLEAFGVDPNDPKAVDTVKAFIAAAKQAEDAKKSAEDKAKERIEALEKERDAVKAEKEALELKSRLKDRDDEVKSALTAARCTNPSKVMALISVMQADDLKATLKDDGTLDKAKVTALVDAAKKEHKEYFVGGGPGIPATAPGGRATTDTRAAQDANLARARRDI